MLQAVLAIRKWACGDRAVRTARAVCRGEMSFPIAGTSSAWQLTSERWGGVCDQTSRIAVDT